MYRSTGPAFDWRAIIVNLAMKNPPKDYAAIIGNSANLCVLSRAGLPIRLFWPNLDYGQHLDRYEAGLIIVGREKPLWLDDPGWTHSQSYTPGANIVETESEHNREKVAVSSRAFASLSDNHLVFTYKITNKRKTPVQIRLCLYCVFRMEESPYDNTSAFDISTGVLVFYRRAIAIAISGSKHPSAYHCGVLGEASSARQGFEAGLPGGNTIQHKAPDGGVIWDAGSIDGGEAAEIDLFVVMSRSLGEVLADSAQARERNAAIQFRETIETWRQWAGAETRPGISDDEPARPPAVTETQGPQKVSGLESESRPLDDEAGQAICPADTFTESLRELCGDKVAEVYSRSLLTLKLLSDRSGGIIAAPEFDREREVCGGYGYVWPRDGAFIAHSLDLAGKHAEARAYFEWAKRVQEPSGVWLHRYYCTGELAPSWGLVQIDETGAMIWSMVEHSKFAGGGDGVEFLNRSWNSIERGAHHLASSLDSQTGLPSASFDLWEEDFSESVYAAAATFGGLAAAAHCAETVGNDAERIEWSKLAEEVRSAIVSNLWDRKAKGFRRSIKKRISEQNYLRLSRTERRKYDPEVPASGPYAYYTQRFDSRAESSTLGLVFPFRVFQPAESMISRAVTTLRRSLWCKKTGGIKRYEDDRYVGGNPWILTTLWLAIYYLEAGDRKQALKLIRWAAEHATGLDLLTEQIDRKTGEPVWAVPLGWSHAMFIIAVHKLIV